MGCGERMRLLVEYSKAARAFSDAVLYLHARTGEMSKETYEQAKRDTDDHRIAAKQARLALDQHTSEHGCGNSK